MQPGAYLYPSSFCSVILRHLINIVVDANPYQPPSYDNVSWSNQDQLLTNQAHHIDPSAGTSEFQDQFHYSSDFLLYQQSFYVDGELDNIVSAPQSVSNCIVPNTSFGSSASQAYTSTRPIDSGVVVPDVYARNTISLGQLDTIEWSTQEYPTVNQPRPPSETTTEDPIIHESFGNTTSSSDAQDLTNGITPSAGSENIDPLPLKCHTCNKIFSHNYKLK